MVWIGIWIVSIILCHLTIHYASKRESNIDSEDVEAIIAFIASFVPIINLILAFAIWACILYDSKIVQKYLEWLYGDR